MSSRWKGTSLKLSDSDYALVDLLKQEKIDLREDEDSFILENQEKYFICENDFIDKSTNLNQIITKFIKKDYSNKSKVLSSERNVFENVQDISNDLNKYLEVVRSNIIDGDIREIKISLNILNSLLNDSRKSKLFLDILILFALGTRVSYDAESVVVEFISDEDQFKEIINIARSEPIYLYSIYNWIFNDEEFKDSYRVKLHIVRQIIIRKKNTKNVEELLVDCKLAYKRIISKKTDEYFSQINQLKDDFLILSKNENNVLRTLNVTFFAWLGYLGIELFKIIANYQKSNILEYLFFSTGAKKGIIILMFIIALVFIFLAYVLEVKSLRRTYDVIETIYKDKILFEEDSEQESKFEKIINKPQVGKLQKIVFAIVLITLLIRFFVSFPW